MNEPTLSRVLFTALFLALSALFLVYRYECYRWKLQEPYRRRWLKERRKVMRARKHSRPG